MRERIFYVLILVWMCSSLKAQEGFARDWESMFGEMRQSGILRDSCLWEFGFTDTSIFRFKGNQNDDTASFESWSEIYQYWEQSTMDVSGKPRSYDELIDWFNVYFKQGIVPVPALLAKGDRISRSAFSEERIFVDSVSGMLRFNNVLGEFESAMVFMSVPFVQQFNEENLRLFFSDSFFLTNTDMELSEIEVKLNEGLFEKAVLNQPMNFKLNPGVNHLTFKHIFKNGRIFFSVSKVRLDVNAANFGNDQLASFHIGDHLHNIYAEPYRPTETGEPLGANVEILPGRNGGLVNTCIRKPLIFVEGIDFGYKDHETGCYGGKCGSIGLRDLMRGKIYHPYERFAVNRFEEWKPIEKAPQFLDDLRNDGYDVIYLDFHNGADYMENNAMLLIDLIKRVNFAKCSNEEIVVIGASMGGQICKFALTQMENNGIPHCVRTFLAFDSPNQGANIPLGLQHFIKYYKGKLPTVKDKFERKLNRPASKQLLMLHCQSSGGAGEDGLRVDFTSKLASLGNYPKKCRKIALINGSINADDQHFESGDVLLKMNPYLGKMNFDILEVTATVWSVYNTVEFKNVIMEAQYLFRNKKVVEVPVLTPRCDNWPGSGRFDVKEARSIFVLFNVINKIDQTCFIPSISALDLYNKNPYFHISANIPNNIPSPEFHPFDAFFGEEGEGLEHMMLTDANINWMLDQFKMNENELPETLTEKYNLGRNERSIVGNLTVGQNGILCVNCDGSTGFGNGKFDRPVIQGSEYVLRTNECDPYILIESGGQLVLGAESITKPNKGIFRVCKGATLELKAGSVLNVEEGSELIIEEGAILVMQKDAKIILDGDNALIQLDGTLVLGEGAILSFEQGNSGKTGYLKFRSVGGGYGAARIESIGVNTGIKLIGTDMEKDVMLQIEGELEFGFSNPFKSVSISNCKILFGNSSSFKLNGDFNAKSVIFANLPWATKRKSNPLELRNFNSVKLENCIIREFDFGFIADSDLPGSEVGILKSSFEKCNNGISINAENLIIDGASFKNNAENAVITGDLLKQIDVGGSQFYFNFCGINSGIRTKSTLKALIENCTFGSNSKGLLFQSAELSLACNRFVSNSIGLEMNDGVLIITPDRSVDGKYRRLAGGNNTFVQYSGSAIQFNNALVYLKNGMNNFIHYGKETNLRILTGNVAYSTLTHEQSAPYMLRADGNFWFPTIKNGLQQASQTHYDVKFPYPGSGTTMNYLNGTLMSKLNTKCYGGNECNPCGVVEDTTTLSGVMLNTDNEQIRIYPQPASDQLIVETDANSSMKVIRILGIDGKVYCEKTLTSCYEELELKRFSDGLYILEYEKDNSKIWRPLLIRH